MAQLCSLEDCRADDIERLLDAAFGGDRTSRTAYMLRDGTRFIRELSFGVKKHGTLIGSIQCWPVMVTSKAEKAPLILVGPVAVHPDEQNSGHGHTLMQATLEAAKRIIEPPMVMIGDAEYYGRFGFSAEETGGWTLPGPWEPHRLLLRNPARHPLIGEGMVGPDKD